MNLKPDREKFRIFFLKNSNDDFFLSNFSEKMRFLAKMKVIDPASGLKSKNFFL